MKASWIVGGIGAIAALVGIAMVVNSVSEQTAARDTDSARTFELTIACQAAGGRWFDGYFYRSLGLCLRVKSPADNDGPTIVVSDIYGGTGHCYMVVGPQVAPVKCESIVADRVNFAEAVRLASP